MSLTRRNVLRAAAAAGLVSLSGCGSGTHWRGGADEALPRGSTPSASGTPASGARPSPSTSASPSATSTTAAGSSPQGRLGQTLTRFLKPTRENPNHPTYAGAVALVSVNGEVVSHVAVGDALRYGAGPVELSAPQRVAMRPDSIFDLASITKVYVAVLALRQVDRGRLDLAAPVVDYLPGFAGPGKEKITAAMLLAHTSGLPVGAKVSGLPDDAARRAAVLATPLIKNATPGNTFRYSSVGLMVLAQLVEKLTGERLDAALRDGITGPLGLRDTGFTPLRWLSSADRASRLVATDARSSRGLLRGVVHDQVANTLGGIAGHAGIFSTAKDLHVIGQMLLGGGQYRGVRILAEATVRRMLTNVNAGLPAIDPERPGRSADHGLGVELNQPWFMGRLAHAQAFGHTGFTGASLLVDPRRRLVLVLLTNRAHPNWSWANPDPMRVAVANAVVSAL